MLLPRLTPPVVALALLLAACAPPGLADRDGGGEAGVYVVNADGSGLALLVADAGRPAWSPDGTRLAFVGQEGKSDDRYGDSDIYVVNADGSGRTRAGGAPGDDFLPVWSPDGTRLAFNNGNEGGDLYVGRTDGSPPARVARLREVDPGVAGGNFYPPEFPAGSQPPAWSPDGEKIAFGVELEGEDASAGRARVTAVGAQIDVVGADGSGRTRLTDVPGQAGAPAWSPDGTRIAFVVLVPDGEGSIAGGGLYVVGADGASPTQLTDVVPGPEPPAWSPDGARLLFASLGDAEGRNDLYVVNADGSGLTNLTDDDRWDADPAWSPDGATIAFAAAGDGWDLYVMDADGSGERRVAGTGRNDRSPAWSPDGTVIAFASWPEDSYRD